MQRVKDFVKKREFIFYRQTQYLSSNFRSVYVFGNCVLLSMRLRNRSVFGDGDGLHTFLNLSYGQVTNIINAVLFVLMLLFGRKYINIGTIINFVVAGVLIDAFNAGADSAIP